MQYILSQEEFDSLIKKTKQHEHIRLSNEELMNLCQKIADTMPVNCGWGGPDPKPWGCKYTKDFEWYCDSCPVQKICPADKDWSQ